MASVHEKLKDYVESWLQKNPPVIGGGRRTIIMPEPQPEDARDLYETKGDVKEGFVRAEITHRCWASKDGYTAIRLFKGDVVDLPDAEFAILYERNWAREPWKPNLGKTKPQAS